MKQTQKRIIAVAGGVLIALIGVIAWWQFGPGRNVYAVDVPIEAAPSDCAGDVRLAVIGDYGDAAQPETDVAEMVNGWQVDFIVTVGDNNYPDGKASTMDENIGQYYHAYIHPYQGSYREPARAHPHGVGWAPGGDGRGAIENRFFPALGNHDWNTGSIEPHLDYFTLPGNERYYDVTWGPVHLFVLDSNEQEPDGRTATSVQAQWLQAQLTASTSPWKLISLHHAPYSSGGKHGDDVEMQWPFAEWGATAVLAGHEHSYERIHRENILYFINGLGGRRRIHPFDETKPGSAVCYNQDYGAMLITAGEPCMNFTFFNRSNEMIDSYTLAQ